MSNSIQFSAISGQQSARLASMGETPKQKHSFLQKNSHQQSAVSKEEVRYIYRILMKPKGGVVSTVLKADSEYCRDSEIPPTVSDFFLDLNSSVRL